MQKNERKVLKMKKALLLLMAALLLFTAACSGGLSVQTTTTKATAKNQAWKDLIKEEEVEDEAPVFDVESIAPVTAQLIGEDYPTDNAFYPEYDDDLNLRDPLGVYVEELGRYYMMTGNFLLYAEEDEMNLQPLCTKEGCEHNLAASLADKRACEAWFHTDDQRVVLHYNCMDGRLYLAHYSDSYILTLTSILSDGSDRREEFVHEGQENTGGAFNNMIFHRGRFYYTFSEWKGNKSYINQLWSYALNTPDAEPELLYTAQNLTDSPWGFETSAYGRYLYITEDLGGSGQGGNNLVYGNAGLILDLTSGEWLSQTRMHNVPEEFVFSDSFVRDGKLVSRYENKMTYHVQQEITQSNQGNNDKLEDVQQQRLCVESELDGLDPVILEDCEERNYNVSDDNYVCDFLYEAESANQVALNVCDHAGNVVREVIYGEFFPEAFNSTEPRPEGDIVYYASWLVSGEKLILRTEYHVAGVDIFATLENADYVYYVIEYADIENQNVPIREVFRYNEQDYT